MTLSRRLLVWSLGLAVAFAAGFGAATLLMQRGSSASVDAQSKLYDQVLADLQRDYYKPVDVAQLGRSGIDGLLSSLHDPYTQYFTPQQARLFGQALEGGPTRASERRSPRRASS